MRYAKIDRSTGAVIKMKIYTDNMDRPLNKPFVWLTIEQKAPPVFDKETHKLVGTVTQPDLSDLSLDVPVNAKRVIGTKAVILTAEELQDKIDAKIDNSNNEMARAVELILTRIATKSSRLVKSDFPEKVWERIDERRALSGQPPL